jgi:hypothetical protein
MLGISVPDPAAMPAPPPISISQRGRKGSTGMVKRYWVLGMVPPISGQTLGANDNSIALAA